MLNAIIAFEYTVSMSDPRRLIHHFNYELYVNDVTTSFIINEYFTQMLMISINLVFATFATVLFSMLVLSSI